MTDDYLLDDLERSQQNATQRRRANRSRRYYRLLLLSLGFVALITLAAPSLISQTGVARSLLASAAGTYGWQASAESIRVGWITPLSIQGLELIGQSGETILRIERADTALTVTKLIAFDSEKIGEVSLRGVSLAATVTAGQTSIEADLAKLLEPTDEASTAVHATIQIQDLSAAITDSISGRNWILSQSNVNVAIDGMRTSGEVAGVVNEPGGSGGSVATQFVWQGIGDQPADQLHVTEENAPQALSWELKIKTESFPLSVADLVSRRFASPGESLANQFSGDTTGTLHLTGQADGAIQAELGDIRIRNLKTVGSGNEASTSVSSDSRPVRLNDWSNQLATLKGEVALVDGRLLGRGLEVTTDFASAAVDGSFPTSISLVGSEDNPLSWLQALDGKARIDVDLALLDQALPGLIPLRSDVALVSGRARGIIENTIPVAAGGLDQPLRRSQLTFGSDLLRARADGRIVVIDPMEMTATVTADDGALRAEQFSITSQFAKASGNGTLRDGTVEVTIDFGRLYTMLRPVIDLSDLSLGGTAKGEIHWTVQRALGVPGQGSLDRWELKGSGDATDLLVTLPSGYRFKRNIVQGRIAAQGQWNGRELQQLTSADVEVRSGGVLLNAALTAPVSHPTGDSMYAVRVESDGRLEYFNDSLRPWLPESLQNAEGRLQGSAYATVSRAGGTLSKADMILSQPRINYQNSWYSQQSVTINFEGVLDYPSARLHAKELTVRGEAISLAVRGEAMREKTNLDIAWNADLKKLQDSIGSTIARAATTKMIRPISYRPVQDQAYQISGLCRGNLNLTGGPEQWQINSTAAASNVALHAAADSRNLPPGTILGSAHQTGALIWQEPQLNLDAQIAYDRSTGTIQVSELQVSSDGFTGTLTGQVKSLDDALVVQLAGPSQWQMDVMAGRMTTLLGTEIRATGVHKTKTEIELTVPDASPYALVAKTELGWEQCEAMGIRLGRSTVPIRITDQTLDISPCTLPIVAIASLSQGTAPATGQVSFAAKMDYSSSPMTIRLAPGAKIDALRITPESAAGWLKYLAPLVAGATSIDGVVAASFQEAVINLDDPSASLVRGNLDIQDMRVSSGPLANQLIQGVEQIKSIVRLTGGQVEPSPAKTLIEMPPQTVEFTFENGIATHQRMYFKIDRANLVTSGRVATDSRINLVAQVPLDARWLGSDLKGLAGQSLSFPISGTLERPTLDDSAVRNMMLEMGNKVAPEMIQNRLNGLLQKQLGSGMDQINTGLGKILGL